MKVNQETSDQVCSSNSYSQGCVLSPKSRRENRTAIKYPDDSVIVSRLQDEETSHTLVIEDFVR